MTKPVYLEKLEGVVHEFDPNGSNRYFVFGSSIRRDAFHDIDLGVVGNAASGKRLAELRDRFYDSDIPYNVDVVDFDTTDHEFRDYVIDNEPIVWIR